MELWQEPAEQWWAAASREQKLAVMAVIRDWGMDQADHPDLELGDSRLSHRLLAGELRALLSPEHSADAQLLRSWYQQPPGGRALWVQAVAVEFEPASPGYQAAREVSLALAPPPFPNMTSHQQVSLLMEIAQDIDQKLEVDPRWYGKETRAYQQLAGAIHTLMDRAQRPEAGPCDIQWSHMEPRVRESVLGEIGEFARMAGRLALQPEVIRPLMDVARSALQIVAPERAAGLER